MTALPKSTALATVMLERFAELDGLLAAVEERRSAEIAKANADADAEAAPIIKELGNIHASLEPWWPAAAPGLANGKKSVQLGGCMIGMRQSRARLGHGFGSDDKAVEALQQTRYLKQTTKVKHSLDRAATMKLLQLNGKAGAELRGLGFKIDEPGDKFFVERVQQAATIAS